MLALAIGAPACKDGVVPGDGYDRPLISPCGKVQTHGALATLAGTEANSDTDDVSCADSVGAACVVGGFNPIVGLLWTDPLQRMPDLPAPARWLASAVSVANDKFKLDVFRPPPAEALVEVPVAPGATETWTLALAEMVMINDKDCDGTFQVGTNDAQILGDDEYLAGANTVLVYLAHDHANVPESLITLAANGRAGYQLITYDCALQVFADRFNPPSDPISMQTLVHMDVQPSRLFPDTRACVRTHAP